MQNVVAVILGGGKGIRLQPLTEQRCKPAVPVGGNYRMVDIPISNCINGGIHRIFVLTQYRSASLNRHISQTYSFDNFTNGFVDVLAADQSLESENWFQGSADAVRRNLHNFNARPGTDVVVMNGDILFRYDLARVVQYHRNRSADVTLLVSPVAAEEASSFGLVQMDRDTQIAAFGEKPKGEALEQFRVPDDALAKFSTDTSQRKFLASIGIYVIRFEALCDLLQRDQGVDFGHDVLPLAVKCKKTFGYPFSGYWRDLGTIRSFYDANLDLARPSPPFSFYDAQSPIYTRPRFLPPSKLLDCRVENSLISAGCLIRSGSIKHSVIGLRSIIRENSLIEGSILMGADDYDAYPIFNHTESKTPQLGVGEGTIIRNAIIDKDARIGPNCRITNEAGIEHADNPLYSIRDKIIIVRKGAVLPEGTVV